MGTFEPYVPPRPRRSPPPLGVAALVLAVLAIGLLLWLTIVRPRERTAETEVAEPAPAAVPEQSVQPEAPALAEPAAAEVDLRVVAPKRADPAKDRRIAELELLLGEREHELARQWQEIQTLQAELDRLRQDADRYREGLEQATEEMNRLSQEVDRLQTSSRQRWLQSVPPAPEERVHPLGAPYVTISQAGFVVVSGQVYNPTDFTARGQIQVSLVGSSGVIESRNFPMYLAPNSRERYDITFPGVFPTERIAAQASWVD
jgi:hypothetical protein